MAKASSVTTLLLDIGGVLLTNGWDRYMRRHAAEKFEIDREDMEERHHLTFDTYEEGWIGLDEYLDRTVFFCERLFSREEFKAFMFSRSERLDDMMDLISRLKTEHSLRCVAVSNEGRELTVHRVQKFELKSVIDFFVSSCFVHYRKPDTHMFRMALDMAQVKPENAAYIDDRLLFVEVAGRMGIRGIYHTGFESTRSALADLGLVVGD